MAKTFKNAGAAMESAGAGLTKTITGPVAAIGTASVAAFNEVDGALDTITKKTGATGDAMKTFRKSLKTSLRQSRQTWILSVQQSEKSIPD